ncbi:MAG: phosphate ABC transporter ATP-binding protein [Leptolyngbya sp. SIO3F4]|nr:phosphate ABC transporter ATP-binding protein [Leptolyngbya sp. SIO3F4]
MTIGQVQPILQVQGVDIAYGSKQVLHNVSLKIPKHQVTAFIGPSGCGKSSLLRCFNRLNDLINGFHLRGKITYHGHDLYAKRVDPVAVRRQIGMVFQRPNPFPKSIYENVAYGARAIKYSGNMEELVETSLRRVALWDEVKDKLNQSGLSLSGGQQQRLCIARTIAVEPDVVLMDEPCSALDPISTFKIEELMHELKQKYTIVVVTHNMQQAARISQMTAFFSTDTRDDERGASRLIEYGRTNGIFNNPKQRMTCDYVSGRFG